MSMCEAQSDETDGLANQPMKEALTSLERALQILDDCEAPAHIGARLQEIITLVSDRTDPIAAARSKSSSKP